MTSSETTNERDAKIVEEFRANGGIVGGVFEGVPVLILHTTGARSGTDRVSPLVYRTDDDRLVVFASAGGVPRSPGWYYNLIANPQVRLEIGGESVDATAREADGDERERLWSAQKQQYHGFADYEVKAAPHRRIPVIVLDVVRA